MQVSAVRVAFQPNSNTLLMGSAAQMLKVWDTRTPQVLPCPVAFPATCASSDSERCPQGQKQQSLSVFASQCHCLRVGMAPCLCLSATQFVHGNDTIFAWQRHNLCMATTQSLHGNSTVSAWRLPVNDQVSLHGNDAVFGSAACPSMTQLLALLQASQAVPLSKGASSITGGVTAHDVAVGDTAGVVWLYDLRRTDSHVWRLQCTERAPVTALGWSLGKGQSASAAAATPTRSSAQVDSSPPAAAPPPAAATAVATGSSRQPQLDLRPAPAPAAAAAAPASAIFDPVSPVQAPRSALPTPPALDAPAPPPAAPLPSRDAESASTRSNSSAAVPPRRRSSDGNSLGGGVSSEQLRIMVRDAVQSAIGNGGAAAAVPATPSMHTQQLKDHIDAAVGREMAVLRDDVATLLGRQTDDNLRQFQLAQEDMLDMHASLARQLEALANRVAQLQRTVEGDVEAQHDLRNWA